MSGALSSSSHCPAPSPSLIRPWLFSKDVKYNSLTHVGRTRHPVPHGKEWAQGLDSCGLVGGKDNWTSRENPIPEPVVGMLSLDPCARPQLLYHVSLNEWDHWDSPWSWSDWDAKSGKHMERQYYNCSPRVLHALPPVSPGCKYSMWACTKPSFFIEKGPRMKPSHPVWDAARGVAPQNFLWCLKYTDVRISCCDCIAGPGIARSGIDEWCPHTLCWFETSGQEWQRDNTCIVLALAGPLERWQLVGLRIKILYSSSSELDEEATYTPVLDSCQDLDPKGYLLQCILCVQTTESRPLTSNGLVEYPMKALWYPAPLWRWYENPWYASSG